MATQFSLARPPSRGFMDKSRSIPPWWLGSILATALLCAGCPAAPPPPSGNGAAPPEAPATVAIRVTVVDDPHLSEAIQREWQAHSDDEISLRLVSSQELLAAKRLSTDVLVVPAELLGDLVEAGRLAPMANAILTGPEIARDTIFPRLRTELGSWGRTTYALPLGAPTFQLLYRSDVFAKLNLTPPKTWHEYQELLPKLADREALGDMAPAEDAAWSPSAEPLAPGWAHKVLLARAAAEVADERNISPFLDLSSREPRIASPPFERALQELTAAAKEYPHWQKLTPAAARAELLAGRCAMAITWPSGVREENEVASRVAATIRIAALPASDGQVAYLGTAGYLAAVAKDCRRPSVSLKFVTWLTSPESSIRISSQSWAGSPTRDTQVPSANQWIDAGLPEALGGEYFALLQADHARPAFLPALRLPQRTQLQAALDQAVASTLAGDNTPQEALATAADQWTRALEEMDAEQVFAQARRSLNLSQ